MMDHVDQKKKRKRRIMRAFRIDEISAVDRPAQQGARMTLMKRAEREEPMPTNTIIYTRSQPIDIGPAAEVVFARSSPSREPASFAEAVNAIHKREGGSRCIATSKAATEFPALLANYQAEGLKLADQARPEPFQKADG